MGWKKHYTNADKILVTLREKYGYNNVFTLKKDIVTERGIFEKGTLVELQFTACEDFISVHICEIVSYEEYGAFDYFKLKGGMEEFKEYFQRQEELSTEYDQYELKYKSSHKKVGNVLAIGMLFLVCLLAMAILEMINERQLIIGVISCILILFSIIIAEEVYVSKMKKI